MTAAPGPSAPAGPSGPAGPPGSAGPAAAVPRPAATLVVMRPCPDGAPGVEVLMLERSGQADFASGMYVYPGGGVEAEDLEPAVQDLSPRLAPEQAAQSLGTAPSPGVALGYYAAAIRETFEECGVLLARTRAGAWADLPEAEAEEGRRTCAAGGAGFAPWLAARGLCLAAEDLLYFAHWITPRAAPKRYDTRFFLAEAPRGARVHTDQTEIVGHRWTTPGQAVLARAAGRMPMIEPTLHTLKALDGYASPAAVKAALAGREVRTVMPQMKIHPDGRRTVILPWDPAYVPDPEPS